MSDQSPYFCVQCKLCCIKKYSQVICGIDGECKGVMSTTSFIIVLAFSLIVVIVVIILLIFLTRTKKRKNQVNKHLDKQRDTLQQITTQPAIVVCSINPYEANIVEAELENSKNLSELVKRELQVIPSNVDTTNSCNISLPNGCDN